MPKIRSTPWVIWLVLGPLLTVDASPQFPGDLIASTWQFLSGAPPTPTVVNCMSETSASLVSWQNPDFPNNESLPGICTLTLNPTEGTCAYRLNFDNMDLLSHTSGISELASIFSCNVDKPYLKVTTVNYAAPARCQDLAGYEGIVQLPENSTEPVVLLLQTDPNFNFLFRVNISSVACDDIKSFKSPNVCGIKNQRHSAMITRNTLRLQSTMLDKEPKDRVVKAVTALDEEEENSEAATLEGPDASPAEVTVMLEEARWARQLSDQHSVETPTGNPVPADVSSDNTHVANPDSTNSDYRRLPGGEKKKKKKQKQKVKLTTQTKPDKVVEEISEDAKDFAEQLKNAGNILSYGLGTGIEEGKFTYLPNMDTRDNSSPTYAYEWPWMVIIEYLTEIDTGFPIPALTDGSTFNIACNGVLLDESHVLTAASCLPGSSLMKGSLDSVRVILGDQDSLNQNHTEIINTTVSKITFPMSFSQLEVKDDIAVLTLSEPVNYTDAVRPICLPVTYNKFSDKSGVLTGWSDANVISPSSPIIASSPGTDSQLKAEKVKVMNKSACNETLSLLAEQLFILNGEMPSLDTDDFMCAFKKESESSICDVGIGTPLAREDVTNAYYLYGVSNVFNSCGSDMPSVFTAIKPDDVFLNLALTG